MDSLPQKFIRDVLGKQSVPIVRVFMGEAADARIPRSVRMGSSTPHRTSAAEMSRKSPAAITSAFSLLLSQVYASRCIVFPFADFIFAA